ncbi:hypothetical protein PIB30_081816 [Stylosanthes scabra]|uniref:Uncharacterized protein n=1 Tax=Stylosanthes scabra TaxID=79078 RepID=A0ABU6SRZ8_9FABA|nr:hypothetical protein [Stylosanthes scabra]
MGSGVIFYEYEKREEVEDHDMRADAELGTFKIRRYHFDNESFVHPLHSVRFDPNRPYEILIEALMADKIASASKSKESSAERRRSSRRPSPRYSSRTMPVAQCERSTSSVKGTRSFRRGTSNGSEIGGMDPSEKGESSEEDPEMEEEYPEGASNPEDRVPATPSLPVDLDAEEDFQRYVEELGRAPEPSPLRSSQASIPDEPVEAADRQSASRDGPSYDVSGVWPSRSLSPSAVHGVENWVLHEACTTILEQQSSEQVNYMGNVPRQPNFDPHSNTYNLGWRHHPNFGWGGQGNQFQQRNQFNQGQRQFNNNFQQPNHSLVQPNTSKQPLELEIALQKLTLSTTTFIDGTNSFMNETKGTLKNQEVSIKNLEVQQHNYKSKGRVQGDLAEKRQEGGEKD